MFDLEIEKAEEEIITNNAKVVLIQLPDGLKSKAEEIVDFLTKKTKARILVWGGSCFGSCDIPYEIKNLGIDLIIQWGHGI